MKASGTPITKSLLIRSSEGSLRLNCENTTPNNPVCQPSPGASPGQRTTPKLAPNPTEPTVNGPSGVCARSRLTKERGSAGSATSGRKTWPAGKYSAPATGAAAKAAITAATTNPRMGVCREP